MEKAWWKRAVVYQIYPRSFMDSDGDGIGDLKGITSKLEYLKMLGVDVLWICPFFKSPNRDNGYDISDYREIMTEFGTMDDFTGMLDAAHALGLRIVMDLVVNHSSDQNAWFTESRKSKDNPYRDYYIWKDPVNGREPTNWGSYFGGSAWTFDETTGQYYLHSFVPEQPELNWENKKLREEIYDMMSWWCDKGIDGFRMDVISLISKPELYEDGPVNMPGGYCHIGTVIANGPKVHEYLQEMNREVLSKYDLMTVGETSYVTIDEAVKYARADGKELSMVFQFEHMDLDSDEHGKWTMKPLYLPDLKKNLGDWQVSLEGRAWNSLFWNNHDQPRIVSRWGNDSEAYRAVSAKMLGLCLHMMKGTPYIYQGEELGMTNCRFTDIGQCDDIEEINMYKALVLQDQVYTPEEMMRIISRKGRDNARTPMQWDAGENGGFTKGRPWLAVNPNHKVINAASQVSDPDSVFAFYQKLIALRKQEDVIAEGSFELLGAEDERIFAYRRHLGRTHLLVICSFSPETLDYPDYAPGCPEGAVLLLDNYHEAGRRLRPYEAAVWKYTK